MGETEVDDDMVEIFGNSDNDNSFQILDSLADEESLPSYPLHKRMRTSGQDQCTKRASGEKSTTQRRRRSKVTGQHTQRLLRDSKAFESASKFFSFKPFVKAIVTVLIMCVCLAFLLSGILKKRRKK